MAPSEDKPTSSLKEGVRAFLRVPLPALLELASRQKGTELPLNAAPGIAKSRGLSQDDLLLAYAAFYGAALSYGTGPELEEGVRVSLAAYGFSPEDTQTVLDGFDKLLQTPGLLQVLRESDALQELGDTLVSFGMSPFRTTIIDEKDQLRNVAGFFLTLQWRDGDGDLHSQRVVVPRAFLEQVRGRFDSVIAKCARIDGSV